MTLESLRQPLQALPTNIATPPPAAAAATKPALYPIFLRPTRPAPTTPRRNRVDLPSALASSSTVYTVSPSSPCSPRVKRARLASPSSPATLAPITPHTLGRGDRDVGVASASPPDDGAHHGMDCLPPTPTRKGRRHGRTTSISDYFPITAPPRCDLALAKRPKDVQGTSLTTTSAELFDAAAPQPAIWRRPRRRGLLPLTSNTLLHHVLPPPSYVLDYVSRTIADPNVPPSKIALPTLADSHIHMDREHAPALALAFNHAAKAYSAPEASASGKKRLLALGGEQGGIRIVDVDEGLGVHPEGRGHWWRAHSASIFDLQWSADDTRILSASGDTLDNSRLYDLASGAPRLLATLGGHTSTVKATTFIDPLGHGDTHNIIASGGRDGNIHFYDLRCQGGKHERDDDVPVRRSSRTRGALATGDHVLQPVMVLRQPHNAAYSRRGTYESRSVPRTITTLIALQAMPGTLATGGSFDSVVKLWDIRSASSSRVTVAPVAVLPDPTLHGHSPSRRPRSVNVLVEQPTTGDLFALCGDSRVHVLRPAGALTAAGSASAADLAAACILPTTYLHAALPPAAFGIRMALSPDGRHLAAGSSNAGVMVWDTLQKGCNVAPVRLEVPHPWGAYATPQNLHDVHGIDWGMDLLAASSDDATTRIWRPNQQAAQWLREDREAAGSEWIGTI